MKVTYKGHMGSDLEVVNAARVSFLGESTWHDPNNEPVLKLKDMYLIKFLARGCTSNDWNSLVKSIVDTGYDIAIVGPDLMQELLMKVKRMPSHWVPFANGGQIKMHFKVPLFVARQLQKHTAGFNPWSEVSRRYVDSDPEFYVPDVWRGRSADKKQGSTGVVPLDKLDAYTCNHIEEDWDGTAGGELGIEYNADTHYPECSLQDDVNDSTENMKSLYLQLLKAKVAPEQARMVLPQSMYTEFVWSGNLYAWASLYNTRSWGDSQAETANVAQQIKAIVEPLFPVSWSSLTQ